MMGNSFRDLYWKWTVEVFQLLFSLKWEELVSINHRRQILTLLLLIGNHYIGQG